MDVCIRNLGSDPPAQPFIPEGLWAGPRCLLRLEFSMCKIANNQHGPELIGALPGGILPGSNA